MVPPGATVALAAVGNGVAALAETAGDAVADAVVGAVLNRPHRVGPRAAGEPIRVMGRPTVRPAPASAMAGEAPIAPATVPLTVSATMLPAAMPVALPVATL
jgi:hypothetical protein